MIVYHNDPDLYAHISDPQYGQRILAEGDSWFSIGGLTGNLLSALDKPNRLIVSCANPGDYLIKENKGVDSFPRLTIAHQTPGPEFKRMMNPRYGHMWDAVLISAGGNDLVYATEHIVHENGTVNYKRLYRVLEAVCDVLQNEVIEVRNRYQPNTPILFNCYDVPTPKAIAPPWELGPWIGPELAKIGVPQTWWDYFARATLFKFAAETNNLAQSNYRTFAVNCQNVAEAAKWQIGGMWDSSGDWANEIHLKNSGYKKHARKWEDILNIAIRMQ